MAGACTIQIARIGALQVSHFTARRVVVLQNKVDCSENVGEMRARKRHRLDAAEVERAVRPYQIERRLGEALGLFYPCGCHSASQPTPSCPSPPRDGQRQREAEAGA